VDTALESCRDFVVDPAGAAFPEHAPVAAILPLRAGPSSPVEFYDAEIRLEESGRLWLCEQHMEYRSGQAWVEFEHEKDCPEGRERRMRVFVRETTYNDLRDAEFAANFTKDELARIKRFHRFHAPRHSAKKLRKHAENVSLNELLDVIWREAKARNIDFTKVHHGFYEREFIDNPLPEKGSGSPLALEECGWQDLTMRCDFDDDGKIERRLMIDPKGTFHILSKRCYFDSKEWKADIEPITPQAARAFYLAHCIPQELQGAFTAA
jgi:hypothetical protein